MTIYCLTLGPLPRTVAESVADVIAERADANPLALSIIDRDREGWELSAHYRSFAEAGRARSVLRHLAIAEHAITIAPLPDIDWVRQSLAGLAPVAAGRFFVHGSHHRALRPNHATSIEIDAATAFGTGHHATTRGCLLALDRLLKRARFRRALDIGCGTGILAIAFARATRQRVLAIDIDPEAVRVTAANARLNGVDERVRAMAGPPNHRRAVADLAPYDMIFANILARPLVALAPRIARLAAKGGAVVLSGLQSDQERSVEATYRAFGLRPLFRLHLDGWSTLAVSLT